MAPYSISQVYQNGNTGKIAITIGDSLGGGRADQYSLDVLVGIKDSSYTFTGGTPAVSATFGNSGARWSKLKFTSGQTLSLLYHWSTSMQSESAYVVLVRDKKKGVFHTHWGTIPGSTYSVSAVQWGPEWIKQLIEGSEERMKNLTKKSIPKPPPPKAAPRKR